MRSTRERAVWSLVAVLLVAGAAAAWWTHEQWLPHAGPWAEQAWRKATRPGAESLPPDKRPAQARPAQAGASAPVAPQPRKCVQADGRVTYTDEPCPPGSREQALGGAVTSLPAATQ